MDILNFITGRSRPQPVPDQMDVKVRATRYGELITAPRPKYALADEGSYYVATNPTPGTAIVHVVLTAFDDTKPYLIIRNNDSPVDPLAKRIYLDYIKFLVAVVPASATIWGYVATLDFSTWAARYTSGGSAITPVNVNGDISVPSVAAIQVGAITAVAGASSRKVSRGTLRGVIPTINDVEVIQFGSHEGGGSMATAAASGRMVETAPPVIVGPGQNFALNLFGAGNSATPAQFEFEIGYWER